MAVLITHLLKWLYQPAARSSSWAGSIREQRKRISRAVSKTPSLQTSLSDPEWLSDAWTDGLAKAFEETGFDMLPEEPIWSANQMLTEGWFPV
ncbi:DUF29 domain-containing protein [Granulibacter bethesdensis]|nr:DUF29 domain-containing protein [Granulibacter bethesdensis]